jgi:hypothetical protein
MERIRKFIKNKSEKMEGKQTKGNTNSYLIELYKERPIAFNPRMAKISGSITAGLFLCQLLYWHEKGRDKEWVYKTIEEFKKETYLSRSEQDRAIKKWKGLKVLEVKVKGLPQKRHFCINTTTLKRLLEKSLDDDNLPKGESNLQD